MAQSSRDRDAILVAVRRTVALVRVRGRGSFRMGPALKNFGSAAVRDGCRRFILDMDECAGMDSTFMGVLAGLALRLREEDGGEVVMMNVGPRLMELMTTLGLTRVIVSHCPGPLCDELREQLREAVDTRQLDAGAPDRKVTLETMVEAHRDLVEVSPGNLPKFKDVLEYLKEDLRALGDRETGRRRAEDR